MTLCFCGGEIATHKDRAMCMACGHLTKLPAGEPDCSAPAQLPGGLGRSSSPFAPAGAFYDETHCASRDGAKENRARSAGYLHREPTAKAAVGSIPTSLEKTGGLSGAVKAAKPTAMAEKSSPELCRRSPHTNPRGWQLRADAAPGGSLHPQAYRARQLTQETPMTKRDLFPPLASQRDLDREPALPTLGDWFGGIALFAGTLALYFIGLGVAG